MRRAGLRGLAALPRRARTTDSRHGYPIAPNRLARNFVAAAPNHVWLADLTYIPTGEGWLYLAAILDMYTRKIVGWSMRETLHTEIALDALNDGHRTPATRARADPSLRSRHPIRRRRPIGWPSATRRDYTLHEPQRRLLGQRANGELLPHPQDRAGPSPGLRHARPAPGGICSDTSRASTIPVACTQPWVISAQRIWNAERLNPVHFFGGSVCVTSPVSCRGFFLCRLCSAYDWPGAGLVGGLFRFVTNT